jgi:hypothetical protein
MKVDIQGVASLRTSFQMVLLTLLFSVSSKTAFAEEGKAFLGILEPGRLNALVVLGGFLVVFFALLSHAQKGKSLYLRRISGLDAVEEAIGRATEMGKHVMFVNGLTGPDQVATLAAINILGLVTQRIAEYETPLLVANYDPVTFSVEREVVKDAYTKAGKPDSYDPNSVVFVAATQFAYAAATCGMMTREKPATILLLGYFYAEALIFAETGATTGAIQIAGTDATTQLPFFVAACDYTLIGEEVYAASAYLAHTPQLLSSLKTQDFLKFVAAGTAIVGFIYTVAAKSDLVIKLLEIK